MAFLKPSLPNLHKRFTVLQSIIHFLYKIKFLFDCLFKIIDLKYTWVAVVAQSD